MCKINDRTAELAESRKAHDTAHRVYCLSALIKCLMRQTGEGDVVLDRNAAEGIISYLEMAGDLALKELE